MNCAPLLGLLAEQHPVVGQDPDAEAVERPPPGHEVGSVDGLELLEPGAVEDAGQHLTGVERLTQVDGGEVEQLLGVVDRRVGGLGRARTELAVPEPRDDLARPADRVDLVVGEVVPQPRRARVHVRTAQLLLVGFLAGRHPHQRWSAEEDLGPLADEDGVVAHPRHVGAASGRGAEHHRDRRDAGLRQRGQVVEGAAATDEDVLLGAQVGPGGFGEVDHREAVLAGDLQATQGLGDREQVGGTALDRRIRTPDVALHARHPTDPRDARPARVEVGAVPDQRLDLEERAVAVEQQRESLTDEQLAAIAVAFDLGRATTGARLRERVLELSQELEVGRTVALGVFGRRVEPAREHVGHRRCLAAQRTHSRPVPVDDEPER
jgi:hypothetical protein